MTRRSEMQPLTKPHAAAVDAILAGKSRDDAADAAGVSRVTIWRWLRDDDHPVSKALEEYRIAYHREAERKVRGSVLSAVDVLDAIVRDANAQDKDRIAAAREILSRGGLAETKRSEVTVDPVSVAREGIAAMLAAGEIDDDELDALAGDDDTED